MSEYLLNIDKGLTFNETVQIKDDAGVVENLTGSSFLMQFRDYTFSDIALLTATDSNGLLAITPLSGIIDIKLTPVATASLIHSRGVYDLIQIKPTGERLKILNGSFKVYEVVSRT